MAEEVAPSLPALERIVYLESKGWDELLAGAASVGEDTLRESPGRCRSTSCASRRSATFGLEAAVAETA